MKFCYDRDMLLRQDGSVKNTFLLTNGLGGYMSAGAGFGVPRGDQGILVAAVKAPNVRICLVHSLQERIGQTSLSANLYADGTVENGLDVLDRFAFETVPAWCYRAEGVAVTRRCAMAREENTSCVVYELENTSDTCRTLTVKPLLKFAPKEDTVTVPKMLSSRDGCVCADGYTLYVRTNGVLEAAAPDWKTLYYPEDAKDGRPETGMAGSCFAVTKTLAPHEKATLEVVFSQKETALTAGQILENAVAYGERLARDCGLSDPVAQQLAVAADAYIARRDSTGGKTILAGFPFFSDWGRDTMIALPGCCYATGRMDDAKSILRTFLAYEKDGLVPNLFPEGDQAPMYNTVDAALLLIDAMWQYVQRTGDEAFLAEAFPVLERIVENYRKGTHHGIGMDTDGLVYAGQGLDQVTWMDVCVQGILPTPRHGKPVEINAYWYNALMILDAFAVRLGADRKDYAALAAKVKTSFLEKFYMEDKGYLKDVLSGTEADGQIRCNQIWALSMAFTMLEPRQEKHVLDTVTKHLYTPWGLRTLSPEDGQYRGFYGGPQLDRDLAYHQGTVWVFPMGAYYRACLKINGDAAWVKSGLENLKVMMTQGCAGQLPEIYDGNDPYEGKGCFAQAWSVGEMLRVYEVLEQMEETNA